MTQPARRLDEKRGLSREEAASYINVGVTLFDEMVADGRAPLPKQINSRTVWDRWELDAAFSALPTRKAKNPFDAPEPENADRHA